MTAPDNHPRWTGIKITQAALAVVLAGAAMMIARSEWTGTELVHSPRHPIPEAAEAWARRDVPGLTAVSLRTSDGLLLRGWYAPPGQRRAVVILVHGGGGNRLQLYPEARILARHGYGFLVYDSRGQGESEGDRITWGDREQRDLSAVLDFVSSLPEVDPARVAVLGFSIGGSTVTMTAARDQRARAVILYATWTSLEDEMHTNRARFGALSWGPILFAFRRAGIDLANVRPISHIHDIAPRPLLMIAGTDDSDTPVPVMQRLFAAAGEPKELWIVPGVNHESSVAAAPREYESRVISFLDRAFPSPPVQVDR